MVSENQIIQEYHHLLMLDNDTDKEKQWIKTHQPKAAGLSTIHFHILSYLEKHPDVVAKQIASELEILRGTLSKQLTVLEQRQMIVSHQDPADARSKHYQLTLLGGEIAKTHDQLLKLKSRMLKDHLKQFSKEELKTIQTFLVMMNHVEESQTYPKQEE